MTDQEFTLWRKSIAGLSDLNTTVREERVEIVS